MQSQPEVLSMHTAEKFPRERPFSLDEYLQLLSEQGDLTYDPDSSYVPDISIVERHDPVSAAGVVASGPAVRTDQATWHAKSSIEPADDSGLLSQCTYLEDVPISELLFDAERVPHETALAVSPAVPAAPAAVSHQTAGSSRMSDISWSEAGSNVQSATEVVCHTSLVSVGPEIVLEIMADDVIDLEREVPMVVNDAFLPASSYSEHTEWDGSGADQQVPSSSDDEETLEGRRRIMHSCTRDAVVPIGYLMEE